MKLTLYNHADKFLDDNREFIYKNSVEADLVYMNAHCSLSTEEGFYGASVKDGDDILLSIQVGSFPRVHFSNSSDAGAMTDLLVESYVNNNQLPKTINGDTKTVNTLLASFRKHDLRFNLNMDMVKRKCNKLENVDILDKKIVNAKELNFDFTDYYIEFLTECNMTFDKKDAKEKAAKIVKDGNLYALTEKEEILTIAASSRKTEDGRAINMVYTPPEHRGKGYSTCCVKQLTEIILKDNDYAFLYANKANPISNHVYEKLGYKVFGDVCQYNLENI